MLVKKEVDFICRTCLKIGTNYFNLFNYFEDGTALSYMLIECISRQAQEDDGLPSHICSECKAKLYSSWVFKSLALEAESKLRNNTTTSRGNEEPDIIKIETVVISDEYNIDGIVQVRRADPFLHGNYSVNDELSTNNREDSMYNENDTTKSYEKKHVEYLQEAECKNEIIVANDNSRTCHNEFIDCSISLGSLEEKSFNLEGNTDNKVFSGTEDQKNSNQYFEKTCINNDDKITSKVRKLRNKLAHNRVQNKTNIQKEYQKTNTSENDAKVFICSSCNRSFSSRKSLRMHMTIKGPHIHDDRHICHVCGIECDSAGKLKYHKEMHVNEPLECGICKKVFKRSSSLKKHIKRHTQSKPICELCGKVYLNIFTLRKHYATHNTERTVPCPTCGKLFTNQDNMGAHLRFHTARESHICEYCNKGFKTASRKKRHVLIHTGERPYPCKVCDKRFGDDGTLYRHMMTHTGETKFACNKCPYKCRYKQQFDNHLKKHK